MIRLLQLLKRYNYTAVFLLLCVVSIVLMVRSNHFHASKTEQWANGIAGHWYRGVSSIDQYFGLITENNRLAAENARLRAQMEESYISYRDTLFSVRDTVYRQRYAYIEADVIKNSWSRRNNYIMISRGSKQGIELDMAVISSDGIVGVVVGTTDNFATIMPVLHSDSRNSVKVKSSGIGGSLVWDGRNYHVAQVVDVPSTHKFSPGDTIVTSGLAEDFPEGINVGYVDEVHMVEGSGFCKIDIILATDFNKLRHVYVINNRFRAEQQQLTQQYSSH
ncbi:MAG: rod shape-determining protein MreC [Bacteroidales bacterium]|nr:rod shape-determining protein MreC [Bacteroidales bacterium]